MFDSVDPRSPTPIYAQIATRVRLAVAAGDLRTGDALPSVRVLAADLRVNPATVVQAYRELASEGVVEMRQGAGSFIAEIDAGHKQRVRRSEARRLARDVLEAASRAGISVADLRAAIDDEAGGRKA